MVKVVITEKNPRLPKDEVENRIMEWGTKEKND